MRAAIVEAFGEAPRLGEFAAPVAEGDEVLVTVAAAALKQLDRALAGGRHYASPQKLPVVCGTDGVGITGTGDRVYFAVNRHPFGAMAQVAPASWTVPVPDDLDNAVAAAIVNPAIGAWLPLQWRGRLEAGETVLVMGATGTTGRIAVAAARLLGAGKVVAAGRNQEALAALDADETIDLALDTPALRTRFTDLAADGIDLIIDYVWGAPVELLITRLAASDLAKSGGKPVRLVSVGEMAGSTITLPSTALRGSWLEIVGSGTGNFPPLAALKATVREIFDHAASGAIGIAVDERPLAEVEAAWIAASARRIVLVP